MNAKEFIKKEFKKDDQLANIMDSSAWITVEELMEAYARHRMEKLSKKIDFVCDAINEKLERDES